MSCLIPYLEGNYHGFFFLVLLDAFKKVKDGVFGNNLVENWEQVIADFKSALDLGVEACDMKITPKFHNTIEHVTNISRNKELDWPKTVRL